MSGDRPRDRVGGTLTGSVLEIGPGHVPYPVGAGASVRYADRPIEGGRDLNFPELVGEPWGPPSDLAVDLDVDGLTAIEDASLDAVVASHVLEHVAAPIAALAEFERVLRPGGRTVLVVPERRQTFDASRAATPLAHLLAEHAAGVREVSDDHIRDFCAAVHALPRFHPEEMAHWHDPDRLDAEMYARHRRRSIHVHVWSAEEMAATIAGLTARGLLRPRLVDSYFAEDENAYGHEFGLVLARAGDGHSDDAAALAAAFVDEWVRRVVDGGRDLGRLAELSTALARDVGDLQPELAARPARALLAALTSARAATADAEAHARRVRAAHEALRTSPTHRAGEAVTSPVRLARRLRAGRPGRPV